MKDDVISRQAALDALEWKWAGKAAIEAIKNLPSAQPTVDAVPVDEPKNRDVTFYDKGKAFEVFFPIGLDLDAVNKVEIRGRKFVPVKSIEQLKWERDTAIQQLEEHGIPFCGKADVVAVVRCGQCTFFRTEKCTSRDDGWYCADGEMREKDDLLMCANHNGERREE